MPILPGPEQHQHPNKRAILCLNQAPAFQAVEPNVISANEGIVVPMPANPFCEGDSNEALFIIEIIVT